MRMSELSKAPIQRPVTPVEAIAWAMDKRGLQQKDLCPYIGSESLVSEVMNGTRSLANARSD